MQCLMPSEDGRIGEVETDEYVFVQTKIHPQDLGYHVTKTKIEQHVLKNIAKKHGVSRPQVLINWATRQGVMVLPASNDSTPQESNLNSFNFVPTDIEMEDIKPVGRASFRKARSTII
jgi:diketogulonate reductase-like aldo/keto reductase